MHLGVGHKKQGSSPLQDFASGYLKGEQLLKSHVNMAKTHPELNEDIWTNSDTSAKVGLSLT
jgi:hypothetical protein